MVYGFVACVFSFFCELKETHCEWFFTSSLGSKSVKIFYSCFMFVPCLGTMELEVVSLLPLSHGCLEGLLASWFSSPKLVTISFSVPNTSYLQVNDVALLAFLLPNLFTS